MTGPQQNLVSAPQGQPTTPSKKTQATSVLRQLLGLLDSTIEHDTVTVNLLIQVSMKMLGNILNNTSTGQKESVIGSNATITNGNVF